MDWDRLRPEENRTDVYVNWRDLDYRSVKHCPRTPLGKLRLYPSIFTVIIFVDKIDLICPRV